MLNRYFYVILLLISLVISFYFIRSSIQLYSAKNSLFQASNNLENLKKERDNLKKEIEYRKTDEYVVNEARQNLNYSFDGEVTYIVPKDLSVDSTPTPTVSVESQKNEEGSSKSINKNNSSFNNLVLWYKAFF